jgi:hypothetical protein
MVLCALAGSPHFIRHPNYHQPQSINFIFALNNIIYYKVIINDCPIAVGVGDVVECAASLIT